ncbi:MAG: hypothetical protein RSC86_07325, partial [Oscillospiraceae bacterium]
SKTKIPRITVKQPIRELREPLFLRIKRPPLPHKLYFETADLIGSSIGTLYAGGAAAVIILF